MTCRRFLFVCVQFSLLIGGLNMICLEEEFLAAVADSRGRDEITLLHKMVSAQCADCGAGGNVDGEEPFFAPNEPLGGVNMGTVYDWIRGCKLAEDDASEEDKKESLEQVALLRRFRKTLNVKLAGGLLKSKPKAEPAEPAPESPPSPLVESTGEPSA